MIEFSKFRPITLILPSLFSELKGKALPNIINEISKVKYIKNIVIGLDRANKNEFEKAKFFFSKLPQKHEILWHDGPNLKKLDKQLKKHNLAPPTNGKGKKCLVLHGIYLISW